jgi:hypothetical protein
LRLTSEQASSTDIRPASICIIASRRENSRLLIVTWQITIDGAPCDIPIRDPCWREQGSEIVIPPKRNRKVQRSYDVELYKERNLIERFFRKLKQFRRVATRYDKLLVNFMGFVKLAAAAARVSLACEDLFLTAEEEELFDHMERDGCDEDEMIRRVREYNTMKDQEELSVTIAVK